METQNETDSTQADVERVTEKEEETVKGRVINYKMLLKVKVAQ